jgi:F0F1-type ATP synthase assembly protein I
MSHPGRIVLLQAVIGLLCVGAFSTYQLDQGKSALLAGLSSVLPTAYYAWVTNRTLDATRLLLHGVLRSLFTLTALVLCMVLVAIEPLGFFITFAVMQLSYLASSRAGDSGLRK